jgi:hypothetical protein
MIRRDISRLEIIAIAIAVFAVILSSLLRGQQATPAAPAAPQAQTAKPGELGYTDTPMIPGLPYHVHDPARPRPPIVTPAATVGGAPSDAIVLFDGKDLSKWSQRGPKDEVVDAKWPVRDGYFETGAKTGSMTTRDNFGSIQLHVEFATPTPAAGTSQGRGNSGVILMGRYEVQVLDTYNNLTYPTVRPRRSMDSGRRSRTWRARRESGRPTTSCSRRRSSREKNSCSRRSSPCSGTA